MRATTKESFLSRVNKTDTCWLWTGPPHKSGYAYVSVHCVATLVHKYSYTIHKGCIPEGLLVRHTCDTPLCVNPAHLLLGTDQDNTNDCIERGRFPVGSMCGRAKVNEDDVLVIRKRWREGESQSQLAREYGLNSSVVHDMVRYNTWKHVE